MCLCPPIPIFPSPSRSPAIYSKCSTCPSMSRIIYRSVYPLSILFPPKHSPDQQISPTGNSPKLHDYAGCICSWNYVFCSRRGHVCPGRPGVNANFYQDYSGSASRRRIWASDCQRDGVLGIKWRRGNRCPSSSRGLSLKTDRKGIVCSCSSFWPNRPFENIKSPGSGWAFYFNYPWSSTRSGSVLISNCTVS